MRAVHWGIGAISARLQQEFAADARRASKFVVGALRS
jgi:hypothetical protein